MTIIFVIKIYNRFHNCNKKFIIIIADYISVRIKRALKLCLEFNNPYEYF